MRVRWPLAATVLSLGVAYMAYPYVTLYRLGLAIRGADAATLETMVNWPAVREGIKEDVCDLGTDVPGPTKGNELPAFGASFRRGIAANAIDQAVSPQALLAAATSVRPDDHKPRDHASQGPRGADVTVNWAFFDSPTTFLVSLQTPGQTDPIKLEMDLRDGAWQVQRVWLPAELLSPASRT
jgi:hypothetical protein